MTREEFLARLQSVEWDDIEFKEAAWAVPKSALETVSAFANTKGGHLVFGVKESNGTFSVTGVTDIDKLQNDFLGQVRDGQKISFVLPIAGDVHAMPEGSVICFYVPEAPRHAKPVHLDRNPKKAYIRRGSGDYTCTGEELLRFIRDAGSITYDSETLDLDPTKCFDEGTVRWYRTRFEASNAGKDGSADDTSFLREWGFLVEREGKLRPTRAAIVVLGSGEYVRQELPRIVVDLQLYRHNASEYAPSIRWADRVTIEANLIEAWKAVLDFYLRQSEKPFAVDAPRSLAELMTATGYAQRPHFKATHLEPLLDGGILRMTVPDKPTSSKQRYVLTNAGLKLKSLRLSYGTAKAKKVTSE